MNERIVERAYDAMRGSLSVPRIESGWCLRTLRRVLESALGWTEEELYERFPDKIETVTPHPRAFWARDLQRSFRDAGWGIPTDAAKPGDLLFYWKAAKNTYGDYVGHCGILMPGNFVFENINANYRRDTESFTNGALSLTPFNRWGPDEIEAFRVPEDE